MPELPEVEATRLILEKKLKGLRITEVTPDRDDHIVFDQASPEEVSAALEGARVRKVVRRGKYFWIELDRKPWPVFHLGMTGHIEIRGKTGRFKKAWGEKLWNEPKRDDFSERFPPFCRLRFAMSDGTEIAFTDPRRFGRIRLVELPLEEPPISKLGFDPLIDFPAAKELYELVRKRRAPLKSILLDQSIFAGVGNWIADEVLYHSKLSPHRLGTSLSPKEVAQLRLKLLHVVEKAVHVRADYNSYPKTWIFHRRWGKDADAITARGERIVHETIGGRTTAWVPAVQK